MLEGTKTYSGEQRQNLGNQLLFRRGDATSNQTQHQIFRRNIFLILQKYPLLHITIKWVPGHHKIKGNDAADKLAGNGSKLPLRHTPIRSRLYVKSYWKNVLQETWRNRWVTNTTQHTSMYNSIRAEPPSLKTSHHFRSMSRKILSRTVQAQTGHSFTGEYYHQFVHDKVVSCSCSHAFQTRKHIIERCPLFNNVRHVLHNKEGIIDTREILGTRSGINRFAEFLEMSTAFTKT